MIQESNRSRHARYQMDLPSASKLQSKSYRHLHSFNIPTYRDNSPTKPFQILDLPRELRDRILFHICGNQIIDIFLDEEDDAKLRSLPAAGSPRINRSIDLAHTKTMDILLLSRQIAVEAARVLYTTSLFCFRKPRTFLIFVAITPAKHLSLIFKVRMSFHIWNHTDRSVWKYFLTRTDSLGQLKNLKKLYLKLTVSSLPISRQVLRLKTTMDKIETQAMLRKSKALRMLKLATLVVDFQSILDRSEQLRHLKEMRDFIKGQILEQA